jgi:hypothetical protein
MTSDLECFEKASESEQSFDGMPKRPKREVAPTLFSPPLVSRNWIEEVRRLRAPDCTTNCTWSYLESLLTEANCSDF